MIGVKYQYSAFQITYAWPTTALQGHKKKPGWYRGRQDKLQPEGVIQGLDGPNGKPCLLGSASCRCPLPRLGSTGIHDGSKEEQVFPLESWDFLWVNHVSSWAQSEWRVVESSESASPPTRQALYFLCWKNRV